jgi:hypothetical protein
MNGRDAENLRIALVAEWAALDWCGLGPGLLPDSAITARNNEWRDGGVDVVTPRGTRVDVKASRPSFPELMIPLSHRKKFMKRSCPVDVFLKATVDVLFVQFTCWIERDQFLTQHHEDHGERYPFPTMWMLPEEAHPLTVSRAVPPLVGESIDSFIAADVPDVPWTGWLTL